MRIVVKKQCLAVAEVREDVDSVSTA
jgi:hypothetical protein